MHLTLLGCCLVATVLGATPEPRQLHIGLSAEGRAIDAYALGPGPMPVVVVGGMHGAAELNSSELVWQMLDFFMRQPEVLPPGVQLVFVPEANPDGIADGTRELADGVDPNRNWPTLDWAPDTYGPEGRWLTEGGGGQPLSEPETVALARFIDRLRPVAVMSYHSAGGIAMGGPASWRSGVLEAYSAGSGYPARDFLAYPVTGDFAQWCDQLDIPTVEVELTDHWRSELERNLAGVQWVLQDIVFGSAVTPPADDQSY